MRTIGKYTQVVSLPRVKKKEYNITTDEKPFFDQIVKSDRRTYVNICKIATGQGNDYTIGASL